MRLLCVHLHIYKVTESWIYWETWSQKECHNLQHLYLTLLQCVQTSASTLKKQPKQKQKQQQKKNKKTGSITTTTIKFSITVIHVCISLTYWLRLCNDTLGSAECSNLLALIPAAASPRLERQAPSQTLIAAAMLDMNDSLLGFTPFMRLIIVHATFYAY